MGIETIITCDKCGIQLNVEDNERDYYSVEIKLEQEFSSFKKQRNFLMLCSECLATTPQISELLKLGVE